MLLSAVSCIHFRRHRVHSRMLALAKRLIVATRPTELRALPTHDAWFDAEDVVHDEKRRTLTIPFTQDPEPSVDTPARQLIRQDAALGGYRAPVVGWRLTVCTVRAVQRPELWGALGMLLGLSYDDQRRTVSVFSDERLDAPGAGELIGTVRNGGHFDT